jgi:diguanylate cyclase (GGDEF)-like protein
MNAIAMPDISGGPEHFVGSDNLDNLVVELEHYRRQSEWLSRVNELHGRLAGAVDLSAMIEAFSIWLMPHVNHDLIAYQNPAKEKVHMFCSCHGPERREVVEAAGKIFKEWAEMDQNAPISAEDFYVHNWKIDDSKGSILLVVLRKDKDFSEDESILLDKGLKILREPLQRALEYEDLYEQASRDSLTGLANRRVFDDRIGCLIGSAARHGHSLTLACMDLDKFKQINDTYGHMVGDIVLQKVARTMENMVRKSDILVRMGGDEFMLVMSSTKLQEAKILADRLCRAVEELELPSSGSGHVGVSIGLCAWKAGMTKEDWIQQADEALYKAKKDGRSRVCTA